MPSIMLVGEFGTEDQRRGGMLHFAGALGEALERRLGRQVLNPRKRFSNRNRLAQALSLIVSAVRDRPAVVHQLTSGFDSLLIILLRLCLGFKLVFTVHSLIRTSPALRERTGPLERLRRNLIERIVLPRCDALVAPSETLVSAATACGYSFRHWVVIPHGVDRELLATRPRETAPGRQVLVIGGDWREKGADRIPEILSALSSDERLVWVGELECKSSRAIVERFVRPNLGPAFSVYPPRSRMGIVELLDASDLLLVPSPYESFGLVVLEAAARGVPVLVARTVGAASIVNAFGAGRTCDFSDATSIRSGLQAIRADYTKYSRAALAMGQEHGWGRAAQQYIQIYEQLAP